MDVNYGDLLDQAPCGFIAFADDSNIVYVNTTLCERLGFERDELIGKPIETILSVGARIFHQTHFFPLIRLHGHAQEVFLLLRGSTGDDVGMLCNAVRHDRSGIQVTDCVLMEVNERRKFEEALLQARQAADSANAALGDRTHQAERANELLESQAMELELQQQQLQEQAAELESQKQDLLSANEKLRDLNDDLAKQRATADEANQAKSNFLAVMSHELRTPLNAIGGYVQLLEMGVHGTVNDAQREALGRIDRSQRHLLRLINDVLNLSRIEAGRVDYVVEPVMLSDIVKGVTPMVEPQISAKDLQLNVDVPRGLTVLADRDKAQQILLNLLTNAVKFTSAGGSIHVDASRESPSQAIMRVIDTGTGIPQEMLEKVFEPFIQVDASRSRATEGTGLGLAISRDLARGMGGDLTATSVMGQGSTFQLTLAVAE